MSHLKICLSLNKKSTKSSYCTRPFSNFGYSSPLFIALIRFCVWSRETLMSSSGFGFELLLFSKCNLIVFIFWSSKYSLNCFLTTLLRLFVMSFNKIRAVFLIKSNSSGFWPSSGCNSVLPFINWFTIYCLALLFNWLVNAKSCFCTSFTNNSFIVFSAIFLLRIINTLP